MKLTDILKSTILEYSDKTIKTTIDRWKQSDPKTDENIARQLIQRFDQIKNGLQSKLDVVSLPDELKKGNNYLNIDKYSYEDMIKLIKSLPENPEKVKKDAIERFVKKFEIDKPTAQSYVARFMTKRDALKFAAKDGLEDMGLEKEDVLKLIPKRLQQGEAFLDPRNWEWQAFEQILDALFPSQKAAGEQDENLAATDADKVYDKDGIEIYKGDDVHKCISYNPVSKETKRKKYGWCVTQIGNTNYDYYRFAESSPTFYFVFDRSKTSDPEHSPFTDKWHAFVIQVNKDGESYVITSANNDADRRVDSWEGISKIVPSDTWSKIKNLKQYFKPIALSSVERGRKFASGKNLSLEEFKELSQDEKILFIQGKASKNTISKDILDILPKYKIDLEGRSTTLANVAIDSGQEFPYGALKNNESLAKRYAIFRFRHTNYGKKPIPLPYIKYLDEDAKKKYLATFEDNVNFDYVKKYFGEETLKSYVTQKAKELDYIPQEYVKYITDSNSKRIASVYSKLFEDWYFGSDYNMDEENLDNVSSMPEQVVTPVYMSLPRWKSYSSSEKKNIVDLIKKIDGDEKYLTLLYATPYIIEANGKDYLLLSKNTADSENPYYDTWVLTDTEGNIIKDNISGEDSTLGNMNLQVGYDTDSYQKVFNLSDLKTNDESVSLKESKYDDPYYLLKKRAGIYK